jgi:rRNA maturation endonuclease Nob1
MVDNSMRVVLDTSAIIYLNDFRKFDEMFIVDEVVKEVKDKISSMKLSGLNLKIVEPEKEFVKKIEDVARGLGDLEKLSETDKKILALGLEKNCTIVSDDRNIQNVAEKIGIKYISVFSGKITKLITWKYFCGNCKKFFEGKKECPVCGEKLKRVPKSQEEIKKVGTR